MSVGEHVECASALSGEALAITATAMRGVDRSSVSWTFLSRAHDELMRAVEDLAVVERNLSQVMEK